MLLTRTQNILMVATCVGMLSTPVSATQEPRTDGGEISISVTGARSDTGQICALIFNRPEAFPKTNKAHTAACKKSTGGKATFVFKNLPRGDWAAFAFHDEDSNRVLETNFLGMPREGVGTSRGAKGFMGPPKFKDAKLNLDTDPLVIPIQIKYL